MSDTQTYQEYKDQLQTEQAGMTKDDVMELPAEHKIDLDSLPKSEHNWIKRGIKVSCEGAMHPHHSHFLVGK